MRLRSSHYVIAIFTIVNVVSALTNFTINDADNDLIGITKTKSSKSKKDRSKISVENSKKVSVISALTNFTKDDDDIDLIGIKTRRKSKKNKKDRSTSSSSGEKSKKDDENKSKSAGTSLGMTSDSSSSDNSKKKKDKKKKPKSSAERKGWRVWHRKCTPCPDEMVMKWRDPQVKWICGGYQRARRSFKSACMMRYRNCQDGTMFVKLYDHRCKNDTAKMDQPHGEHFFYDYKASLSDQSSSSKSKSKSTEESSSSSSEHKSSGSSSSVSKENSTMRRQQSKLKDAPSGISSKTTTKVFMVTMPNIKN